MFKEEIESKGWDSNLYQELISFTYKFSSWCEKELNLPKISLKIDNDPKQKIHLD